MKKYDSQHFYSKQLESWANFLLFWEVGRGGKKVMDKRGEKMGLRQISFFSHSTKLLTNAFSQNLSIRKTQFPEPKKQRLD